jgi:hypothetical protein
VYCDETTSAVDEYLSISIGRLVKFEEDDSWRSRSRSENYYVQYENIPEELQRYFEYDNEIPNVRIMARDEIIAWSKNKEDLTIQIDTKKYNI